MQLIVVSQADCLLLIQIETLNTWYDYNQYSNIIEFKSTTLNLQMNSYKQPNIRILNYILYSVNFVKYLHAINVETKYIDIFIEVFSIR